MMDEIAKKIRMLRKSKNLTLKELSEKADLSSSFLSQIERGSSTLAITSLKKVSSALDVPISYFFNDFNENKYLVRTTEHESLKLEETNLDLTRISGHFPNRKLECMLTTIPPNQTHGNMSKHLGEEFIYVCKGILLITLDEREYLLKQGDSIHFPSHINHLWENPSENDTTIISINTPSIF